MQASKQGTHLGSLQECVPPNKASALSLLGEIKHKHQSGACHCRYRWGHCSAHAVRKLRYIGHLLKNGGKISASGWRFECYNEGVMKNVHEEVTRGSSQLLQLVHPLVLQNILGLVLNNCRRSSAAEVMVIREEF